MKRRRSQRQLARELYRLLERGTEANIAEFARRHQLKYQQLYRLLISMGYQRRRRHRMLSDAQNREIERLLVGTNKTRREIARTVGCAKVTVDRRSLLLRRRKQREAETEAAFSDRQHKTCPVHGQVSVWPCVACAAEAQRQRTQAGKNIFQRKRPLRRTPALAF